MWPRVVLKTFVSLVSGHFREHTRKHVEQNISTALNILKSRTRVGYKNCYAFRPEPEVMCDIFDFKFVLVLRSTLVQKLKEMKSRKKKSISGSEAAADNSESPTSRSVQLSITGFYGSSKIICHSKNVENKGTGLGSTEGKREEPGSRFSKSVRRRLLFG